MDTQKQSTTEKREAANSGIPRALGVAEAGITTGVEFAQVMSALMSDLIAGRITPQVGNAVCNVGGKLLKVVEMQHRYGVAGRENAKGLVLAPNPVAKDAPKAVGE